MPGDLELQIVKDGACHTVTIFEGFFGSYNELEECIRRMGYHGVTESFISKNIMKTNRVVG